MIFVYFCACFCSFLYFLYFCVFLYIFSNYQPWLRALTSSHTHGWHKVLQGTRVTSRQVCISTWLFGSQTAVQHQIPESIKIVALFDIYRCSINLKGLLKEKADQRMDFLTSPRGLERYALKQFRIVQGSLGQLRVVQD